ncbi:MAG: 4Fe-4S dicluster domain-containing protein [Candidatus Helarchaeota archaeon]
MHIVVDPDRCIGKECERCVDLCPKKVYVINPETGKADPVRWEWCTHCFICASNCPTDAIEVKTPEKESRENP